jgi:hypothetical protein
MDSLREKVRSALARAVGKDAVIELEDLEGGRLHGLVICHRFANMTGTERQDHVWEHLDAVLDVSERRQVLFITTDTPTEFAALADQA